MIRDGGSQSKERVEASKTCQKPGTTGSSRSGGTLYFTNELALLLERAGFRDVELRAGYEEREPTGDDDFVVFVAKKP